MIFAWAFDALAVAAFVLAWASYRRSRLSAGDRLLFLAYAFCLMSYFTALHGHGVL